MWVECALKGRGGKRCGQVNVEYSCKKYKYRKSKVQIKQNKKAWANKSKEYEDETESIIS